MGEQKQLTLLKAKMVRKAAQEQAKDWWLAPPPAIPFEQRQPQPEPQRTSVSPWMGKSFLAGEQVYEARGP